MTAFGRVYEISDGEGNFKKDSLLRAHFLADFETLLKWAWSEPSTENLACKVFTDWDSRRSLLTVEHQEIFQKLFFINLRISDLAVFYSALKAFSGVKIL